MLNKCWLVDDITTFWESLYTFPGRVNLHLGLSPSILQRELINQISILPHLKDFASPFIFTNVTMMMHLMSKSVRCLKTYQSVLRDCVSIFILNIFTFPKAEVFEPGVFNQISANLSNKCSEMCPFVDGYPRWYKQNVFFQKWGSIEKYEKNNPRG